ncbi:MAG TPA: carbon-nitrogen hydrolase family protein [Candidatus Bathyarchaeia archaeon]|nr:carbon-nitrogen hydrolase family protein [Candidatus Bathyarchaeia archaeon]
MKVSLVHLKIRSSLESNLKAAANGIRKAAKQKPAFIALPEYFSIPDSMEHFTSAQETSRNTYKQTVDFLSRVSSEFPEIYIVGGSVLEEDKGKFYNTSTLWKNGTLFGKYRKRNPIAVELKAGVSRGSEPAVFGTECCKVGLIVCADMFDPPTIKAVVDLGAELVFLPVAAMGTHPGVKGHPLTEKLATENGVYVVKVGNVSSSMRGGRSAIIAPWGIIKEVTDAPRDTVVTVELDLSRLREYRKSLKK